MPREKRAAQFAPFDALKGLSEALRLVEYQREKVAKGEVNEETAQKISNALNDLEDGKDVKLVFFDDGYNRNYKGKIKLDIYERKIKLIDIKRTICIDDLLDIELENF